MNMQFLVYRLTSPTGKSYIGYTNKPSVAIRFAEHCGAARRGSNFAIHRAIRKHGPEAWKLDDVAFFDGEDEAKREEISLIESDCTLAPHGYNMTNGGDGFRGLTRTDAHRLAISKATSGRVVSEETKEKLRQYTGERASFYGKKQSPEWRLKMKELMTTNHPMTGVVGELNSLSKQYLVTSPEGEIFKVNGLRNFCQERGLVSAALVSVASGKCESNHGWKVEHVDEALKAKADQRRRQRKSSREVNLAAAAKKRAGPKKITEAQLGELLAAYSNGYVRGFWELWGRKLSLTGAMVRRICLGQVSYTKSLDEKA